MLHEEVLRGVHMLSVGQVAPGARLGDIGHAIQSHAEANGYSVAQEIRRLYGHESFAVQLIDPKGQDKLSRLYSVQHLFAEGLIFAPDKTWSETLISQVGTFPKGKHDDLVDTVSMSLRHLRDLGMLTRGPEAIAEVQESMQYVKPLPPLY